MKKIISIVLVLVLCLSCCFAFTACSDDKGNAEDDKTLSRREEYENKNHSEIAKAYFSAVMESYNGYITIRGTGMDINDYTTIAEVIDFLEGEGMTVTIKNLNTTLTFLGACEETDSGYYVLKDNVDWLDYYSADKSTLNYRYEAECEVAKSSFSAVMESYNGYMTIYGKEMDINPRTTIQDVLDFLEAEGCDVATDHLNTSKLFLDACLKASSGYYALKSNSVEWHDFYVK